MAKTPKKIKEVNEETAAAETLHTHPSDASKSAMLAQAVTHMAAMDKSTLAAVLAQIGHEADNIPKDAAEQNRATIMPKGDAKAAMTPNMSAAIKEDIAELFGSHQLSEEFTTKATVLFEAAVNARVLAEKTALEEAYDVALQEEVETIAETLTEQVDRYVSYCAEQWMEDNEVAIESALRSEITEDFIKGLHGLFAEHNMIVPESEVNVVEALASKVEALEEKLNEQIDDNLEMAEILEHYTKEEIFAEVGEGLALTQIEKLRKLCEGVEFDDVDSYKQKIEIIKENYFVNNKKAKQPIFEEASYDEDDISSTRTVYTDPAMRNYAQAISRTIKK